MAIFPRGTWLLLALAAFQGNAQTGAPAPVPAAPSTLAAKPEAFRPGAFESLPLGAIQPAGWLRRQLVIQANGLSGHLEGFWFDLGPSSAWLGGAGEGWERGPSEELLPIRWAYAPTKDPQLLTLAAQLAGQGYD